MSLIDYKQKISSYLEQGRRFQFLLKSLPSKLTAGDATELSLSPDQYNTSVGQAENYYYMERDAYVDAAPQAAGNTTHSKSNKSDHMPAGFSNVPNGDLPTQGNGAWRKTTNINSKSGTTPSKPASGSNTPSKSSTTPATSTTKPLQNWWSKIFPKKTKEKPLTKEKVKS